MPTMNLGQVNISQLEYAAELLKALSHPLRIAILNLLEEKELTVTQIHSSLNIEQAVASHHLSILKSKDILVSKRRGNKTFYCIKNNNFIQLLACINNCSCKNK